MEDATRKFTALDEKREMKDILMSVYNSLKVKGYNRADFLLTTRNEQSPEKKNLG